MSSSRGPVCPVCPGCCAALRCSQTVRFANRRIKHMVETWQSGVSTGTERLACLSLLPSPEGQAPKNQAQTILGPFGPSWSAASRPPCQPAWFSLTRPGSTLRLDAHRRLFKFHFNFPSRLENDDGHAGEEDEGLGWETSCPRRRAIELTP